MPQPVDEVVVASDISSDVDNPATLVVNHRGAVRIARQGRAVSPARCSVVQKFDLVCSVAIGIAAGYDGAEHVARCVLDNPAAAMALSGNINWRPLL